MKYILRQAEMMKQKEDYILDVTSGVGRRFIYEHGH
jgi:hypothetical protein